MIHDPYCLSCGERYSEHGEGEYGEHDFRDCDDCGAKSGEEHSPKCARVLEDFADAAYESMKEEIIQERRMEGNS